MLNDVSHRRLIEQFDMKHGERIAMDGGAWYLFEDGASREDNWSGFAKMEEPPDDPHQRAKLQLAYRERKLGLALDEFQELQKNLLSHCSGNLKRQRCPASPDSRHLDRLRELHADVLNAKAEAEQARAEVEESKPEEVRRREAEDAHNRSKNQEFSDAVKALVV